MGSGKLVGEFLGRTIVAVSTDPSGMGGV